MATPLGLLSSGTAWGEWNVKQIKNLIGFTPKGMKNGFKFNSLFQGYNVGNLKDYIGYILAAVVGVVIILMIFKILEKVKKEEIKSYSKLLKDVMEQNYICV
ncbi:PDGLE domain-containing protein, partial [Escherichia coli]|nr:PDGLE domain-containing protein [Escherichia coli]